MAKASWRRRQVNDLLRTQLAVVSNVFREVFQVDGVVQCTHVAIFKHFFVVVPWQAVGIRRFL